MGLCRIIFEVYDNFGRKTQLFSYPDVFNASAEGVTVCVIALKTIGITSLRQVWTKFDDVYCVLCVCCYVTDGQTDGQKALSVSRVNMLTRDKNLSLPVTKIGWENCCFMNVNIVRHNISAPVQCGESTCCHKQFWSATVCLFLNLDLIFYSSRLSLNTYPTYRQRFWSYDRMTYIIFIIITMKAAKWQPCRWPSAAH